MNKQWKQRLFLHQEVVWDYPPINLQHNVNSNFSNEKRHISNFSCPARHLFLIITSVSCQQHSNYASLDKNHCGVFMNATSHLKISRNKDAFLRHLSAFLWGRSHCVWPTLPAPVRIRGRQDIRHTLLCPPLCAHRLHRLHGRMTGSLIMSPQGTAAQIFHWRTQPAGHSDLSELHCPPCFGSWLRLWSLTCVSSCSCCTITHRQLAEVRINLGFSHHRYRNSQSVGWICCSEFECSHLESQCFSEFS